MPRCRATCGAWPSISGTRSRRASPGRARRARGRGGAPAEAGPRRAGRGRSEAGRGGRPGGRGGRRQRQGEGDRGPGGHPPDRGRRRPLAGGVRPDRAAVRESAVTRSLLDETRSKQGAAQAARDEVRAQVTSAEAARSRPRPRRTRPARTWSRRARVDVAKSEERRVEAMLGYTKLIAPFDGVITRRNVDPGHLTMPGAAGEPLFVVARTDLVSITVGVPEADAPFVNTGDPADSGPQTRSAARPSRERLPVRHGPWTPATRTLRVEVDLPNANDVLRPGLYAYATIISEEHQNALCVPATAVVADGGKVVLRGGRRRPGEAERRSLAPASAKENAWRSSPAWMGTSRLSRPMAVRSSMDSPSFPSGTPLADGAPSSKPDPTG